MTDKAAIQDFLAQRSLAIVGVSTTGKKFGNIAHRWIWGLLGRLPK